MKRIFSVIIFCILGALSANAQSAEYLRDNWVTTIPVKQIKPHALDQLFSAWVSKFEGSTTDTYTEYIANPAAYPDGVVQDCEVTYMPKNGYLKLSYKVQKVNELQCCYWNLDNGNKLLGIYVVQCYDCPECGEEDEWTKCESALMFYEFNTQNKTLDPRVDMVNRVMSVIGDNSIELPCKGRDIEYYDFETTSYKKVIFKNGF